MASGLNDFLNCLQEDLSPEGSFNPRPYYSHEGDTLFFYAKDVPSYAKRLNSNLTIFLSQENDSVMGFKVKGIQRIIERMVKLGIESHLIKHETIDLKVFFELALIVPPDDPDMQVYENQLTQYGNVGILRNELQPA